MQPLQELKRISELSRKKKRKNHKNIVLLRKSKLNTVKILISKTLIGSYINHDEYVSVNIMLC